MSDTINVTVQEQATAAAEAIAAKVAAENASTALLDGFHVERYNGTLSTIEFGPALTVERYDGTANRIEQS